MQVKKLEQCIKMGCKEWERDYVFFFIDHLNEDLPYGDEGSAELCDEHAANKEIPQTSPEKLKTGTIQSIINLLFLYCDKYLLRSSLSSLSLFRV